MRKLSTFELNSRLVSNGWALVEGQPYTNVTENYKLVCLCCGKVVEKRVKNALRGDSSLQVG